MTKYTGPTQLSNNIQCSISNNLFITKHNGAKLRQKCVKIVEVEKNLFCDLCEPLRLISIIFQYNFYQLKLFVTNLDIFNVLGGGLSVLENMIAENHII